VTLAAWPLAVSGSAPPASAPATTPTTSAAASPRRRLLPLPRTRTLALPWLAASEVGLSARARTAGVRFSDAPTAAPARLCCGRRPELNGLFRTLSPGRDSHPEPAPAAP